MGKDEKLGKAGASVAWNSSPTKHSTPELWDGLRSGLSSVRESADEPDVAKRTPGIRPSLGVAATLGALTTHTEYVDMAQKDKAKALVGLMTNSKDILKNNGIESAERVLAAHMVTEGGRNERRRDLKQHFSGEGKKLGLILSKGSVDIEKLQTDTTARAELVTKNHLSEDAQFLLDRIVSKKLDVKTLKALNSREGSEEKKSAEEMMTESGIDKRAEQYQKMEQLKKDQQAGTKLSKEDSQRLKSLQGMHSFSDMSGLSTARFREIYADGQQRFEPKNYRKLRDDYDAKSPTYLKDQKKTLSISAGSIGGAQLDKESVASMEQRGNHDLLADLATSYGTSQIMGLYASNGSLSAKDGAGTSVNYDLAALKKSKDRLSPTTEDVNMQIAFFNMKAAEKRKSLSSMMTGDTGTLTTNYNGAQPGDAAYNEYKTRIESGLTFYDEAKAADAKLKHPAQNPLSHYAH